jgi:hypothetical protein
MDKLTEGKIVDIVYKNKAENKVSERTIIPTHVPSRNVKALDVSHLTKEQQEKMVKLFEEWRQYYDLHCKQAYNFAEWVELTTHQHIDPTFRTFCIENIQIVSEEETT